MLNSSYFRILAVLAVVTVYADYAWDFMRRMG